MTDLPIEILSFVLEKINEIVLPIINKYVITNEIVSSLILMGMAFFLLKRKNTSKSRRKR